jgi:hypothetical protein
MRIVKIGIEIKHYVPVTFLFTECLEFQDMRKLVRALVRQREGLFIPASSAIIQPCLYIDFIVR